MRNETIDPDSKSALFLGIVYSLYALIGIPANLFVVIATLANDGLRSVNMNIFVLSLALGNMLYLFFACSSLLWALTFDIRICKIAGVGLYAFDLLSNITPPFLAISRYAVICSGHRSGAKLKFLTKRKGILIVNGLLWTFAILFPIPFVLTNKFGLDPMGVCGIENFNSIPLVLYYVVTLIIVLLSSYITTFFFYRKLDRWVRETSARMLQTTVTEGTIEATRNVMTMMKVIMLLPFGATGPAVVVQALLRYDPNIVSIRVARVFASTIPLYIVLDPFFTVFFIKSYSNYLHKLLPGGNRVTIVTAVPALSRITHTQKE